MHTVTLGYEPVEWLRPLDGVKDVLWDDVEFLTWVDETGALKALEQVSLLHRRVADQLITRQVSSWEGSGKWGRSALMVCRKAKYRRQQLRAALRDALGEDRVDELIAEFRAENPRVDRKAEV